MNTFVTDPQAVRHLHLSGFIVATEMVEAHHDEAIDLDPQARELAIFRTNAARHLSGDVLVRAVDAYADDLRKRDQDAVEGRCEACGNAVMFNEPHGATCPLDELVARGTELAQR